MDKLDCVVVGGGVVGLATARALAQKGRDVVLLEAESHSGTHSSSRNSEVIHAGIYYPEKSLKARFCVAGKQRLYEYCSERAIPHRRIGKLIVATDESELIVLDALRDKAGKNGVNDLEFLSRRSLGSLEPSLRCVAALRSPTSGIIDSHVLMENLQADLEAAGGSVLTNTRVDSLQAIPDGIQFEAEGEQFSCNVLVNSAGLWAPSLVNTIFLQFGQTPPTAFYAKGHYFSYSGKSPFKHLIYPVPADGGLGIHATNDLSDSARFGPDVDWTETLDYGFDESRKEAFLSAIQRYFPDVQEERLQPS